ncbi:class I SAM-dependent methyltransferase [Pseudoduganella sp.]|uniref:class I SAM-dependent methyltransferase n=1 Tax=Pseudoduganella sp. TaxID=1880898 RepID=UPI0035AE17D4
MTEKRLDVTVLEALNHLISNHPQLLASVYEIVHDRLGLPKNELPYVLGHNRIPLIDIHQFDYDRELGVEMDIRTKYNYDGILARIYAENKGCLVHKWHQYIPLYDRYFGPYRGKKIRFLEIGVSKGGSLQMWRKYFGDEAIIYGIDLDPECAKLDGQAGQVRIGSQTDLQFLASVVDEMGGVDIVLDDGSHHMDHIPVTLKALFPKVSEGGLYLIEDLHTAYWETFGGSYRSPTNFFSTVIQDLIDDMHHWYHKDGQRRPEVSNFCPGVHIHDSLVVLEKQRVLRPSRSMIA